MATPALNTSAPSAGAPAFKGPSRRLRLEEILTLLQADGLVASADAEALLRSPSKRMDHPLEIIAEKNWHSATGPRRALTLDFLVEWLAGELRVPYLAIDPLKIDLTAGTRAPSQPSRGRCRSPPGDCARHDTSGPPPAAI